MPTHSKANLVSRGTSALLFLLAACSDAPSGSTATTRGDDDALALADFSNVPDGRAGCQPASPIIGNEVMGTVTDGSLYGLLFVEPPIATGEEVKIVWRMTGRGNLHVEASHEGSTATITFGPEPHASSNWNRPGAEWGTGFRFPQPGCWTLRLQRGDSIGNVWINVVP